MSKTILFTCCHFDGYHGSVMHVCELARYLSGLGWRCFCAVAYPTDTMVAFAAERGLEVHECRGLDLDRQFDLVWGYHFPILALLLDRGLRYCRIHVGCLSDFLVLESPPLYFSKCNLCSVVSRSAIRKIARDYGLSEESFTWFPNFIPDEYFAVNGVQKGSTDPLRVLVVSNHPPQEICDLAGVEQRKLSVTFYGMGQGHYAPMTPDIISSYHVVVTIGKTVMYALGAGVPVYEYDYFGGCGYITPENLNAEEEHNFSGRATREKKSTEQIVSEIVAGYEEAVRKIQLLREEARSRYLLSSNVDSLVARIMRDGPCSLMDSPDDRLYVRQVSCIFRNYLEKNDSARIVASELQARLLDIEKMKAAISATSSRERKEERHYTIFNVWKSIKYPRWFTRIIALFIVKSERRKHFRRKYTIGR